MDAGTGGKRFQFSRLRSVFRAKPNEKKKKKNRQDNTGREEEPTSEIWHKQARLYKRSKRLLSYSALVHCAPTSNVSSHTNLESVVHLLPS